MFSAGTNGVPSITCTLRRLSLSAVLGETYGVCTLERPVLS